MKILSNLNKKTVLIAILAMALIGSLSVFIKKKAPDLPPEPELSNSEYFIRSIDKQRAARQKLNPDLNNKIYQPSLHGGEAVFIGPYRAELVVYKHSSEVALFAIFLDNSLAQPVYPKQTDVIVLNGEEKIRLMAVRNGLMINQGKIPKLPASFQIYGIMNGKKFNTHIKLSTFREKKIDLQKESD